MVCAVALLLSSLSSLLLQINNVFYEKCNLNFYSVSALLLEPETYLSKNNKDQILDSVIDVTAAKLWDEILLL